jgi:hypothetical protein
MTNESRRMKLTPSQVTLLNEALVGAPTHVADAAVRIARGEVVPDEAASAVVDALANVMSGDTGYREDVGLTSRGIEIDDLIGVVQQMSEHFYD